MICKNKVFLFFVNLFLLFLVAICIIPFWLMFVSSITSETSLAQFGYSLWPREINLDSYRYLWTVRHPIARRLHDELHHLRHWRNGKRYHYDAFRVSSFAQGPAGPPHHFFHPVFHHAVQRRLCFHLHCIFASSEGFRYLWRADSFPIC